MKGSKMTQETPTAIQLAIARQHVAQWQATRASAELSAETAARFRELGIPNEAMEARATEQLKQALAALAFVTEREQKLAQVQGEAEAADGAEGALG